MRYSETHGRASNYYDLQGVVKFVQGLAETNPRALKGRTRRTRELIQVLE